MITRTSSRAATEPTQLLIDVMTKPGRESGLLHTSAIKCEHLITLHRSFISRVVGRVPESMLAQVDECLKAALGLS
jgi:mRNA-degrading endonuclease toxin of MazEF toxin-antitoxin module